MPKPIAHLALDSRSWGPDYCKRCEEEVEDVLLMDDASIVCPGCREPLEGYEDIQKAFTSVAPYKK